MQQSPTCLPINLPPPRVTVSSLAAHLRVKDYDNFVEVAGAKIQLFRVHNLLIPNTEQRAGGGVGGERVGLAVSEWVSD